MLGNRITTAKRHEVTGLVTKYYVSRFHSPKGRRAQSVAIPDASTRPVVTAAKTSTQLQCRYHPSLLLRILFERK